jgi:hypothetical protein
MRFMPEYISWLFHKFIGELDTGFSAARTEGEYLNKVIKPMYQFLKVEASKLDAVGNDLDHIDKKNYDDVNEYFWEPVCLLHVPWEFDGLPGEDDGLQNSLKRAKKTYMERRGLLHSVKSNSRPFIFYITLFHILAAIGHDVPFAQSRLPLCVSDSLPIHLLDIYLSDLQCASEG